MPVQKEKRTAVAVVSVLVIIAAVLIITMRQRGQTLNTNLDPFATAGEVLADETRTLLGGPGKVVVVTYDPTKAMPVAAAQLKAFQDRLKKGGGITINAVETLPPAPNPGMATWGGAQYLQLAERHAGVDAIVSFVGPPFFSEEEIRHAPTQMPRGLVFGSGGPRQPLRKLFERGIIHVAVASRITPPPPLSGDGARTSREKFDQQYEVVRTETAGTLRH